MNVCGESEGWDQTHSYPGQAGNLPCIWNTFTVYHQREGKKKQLEAADEKENFIATLFMSTFLLKRVEQMGVLAEVSDWVERERRVPEKEEMNWSNLWKPSARDYSHEGRWDNGTPQSVSTICPTHSFWYVSV